MGRCACNRGLGSTDVEALTQAFMGGQIQPTFTTEYFQPAYLPQGQLSAIPSWEYMDAGPAGVIAALLGGSVFQAPPPGNFQGTGIPPANWIRLSDGGTVLPGDLFQPGSVLSFQDLCDAENYFVASIPGGQLGPHCSGAPSVTAVQTGSPSGSSPVGVPKMTPILPANGACPSGYSYIPAVGIVPAQCLEATQQSTPPANDATAGPTQTSGSTTPAPTNSAGSSSGGAVATPATCFNPLSSWLSADTCLGPMGIIEWAVLAAGLLWAYSTGGKR